MKFMQEWEKISVKVAAMTLRERALVFAAIAFLLYSIINILLLDPAMQKQKKLAIQVQDQQEKINAMQIQIDAFVQARNAQGNSPQREQLNNIKQKLAEGELILKNNRAKLVQPEKMAELLRQVLSRNANLQLLDLQTLPVSSLMENEQVEDAASEVKTSEAKTSEAKNNVVIENQIYKHGVVMTVRGNYMELLQYLTALEQLPTQMFWGNVKMQVAKYPDAELTLTLYTLSLDKIWLQV